MGGFLVTNNLVTNYKPKLGPSILDRDKILECVIKNLLFIFMYGTAKFHAQYQIRKKIYENLFTGLSTKDETVQMTWNSINRTIPRFN